MPAREALPRALEEAGVLCPFRSFRVRGASGEVDVAGSAIGSDDDVGEMIIAVRAARPGCSTGRSRIGVSPRKPRGKSGRVSRNALRLWEFPPVHAMAGASRECTRGASGVRTKRRRASSIRFLTKQAKAPCKLLQAGNLARAALERQRPPRTCGDSPRTTARLPSGKEARGNQTMHPSEVESGNPNNAQRRRQRRIRPLRSCTGSSRSSSRDAVGCSCASRRGVHNPRSSTTCRRRHRRRCPHRRGCWCPE